ncbi:uncharacterized protein LOC122318178 isoform X1 [Carya illinoinensis]|uniref:uncharacterized protein LOC122318178 isoform X1 n=1 Tax=Carya illinoinensis TaxID=32201 RepID=UPI001C72850B|nr:uncharacterized protein LOC122318178 isoform X1 [Carya illinoinensis]
MNHSSSCAAVPHSILQTHELNQCITFHRFIPQFRIVVTPLTESRAQWLTRISSVNPAHLTSPSVCVFIFPFPSSANQLFPRSPILLFSASHFDIFTILTSQFPVLTSHFRVLYFLVEICNIYFGNYLTAFGFELNEQRKLVKSLKKKSLWSRNFEEIVKKLLDFSTCIHKAIREAFGNNDEFGSR